MPEMTQNETLTKTRHRKKNRESHNEVERHRKKKINSGISRIGDLIPCSPALKQSKNMILEQAFKYITELKRQNDELLLNGGDKEQACEIRRLRKQLADIQKENARYIELLKSNDICLYDDPTLHWKGKMRNAKASFVVAEPVQKLPLCLNGTQLSSSNHGPAMHGITFNVGQNLQKQTANVVPVQRTCSLVTPVTVSGGYPLGNKPWQANAVIATTSGLHPPLCLPVTAQAPSNNDIPASKGEQSGPFAASSQSSSSFLAGFAGQLHCSSTQTSQAENGAANLSGQQQDLPRTSALPSTSFPPSSSLLSSEVPPVPAADISLQEAQNLAQGQSSDPPGCVETVKDAVKEMLASTNAEPVPVITVASLENSPPGEFLTSSAVVTLTAAPLESSWSLSSSLSASEQKNISSLTRISSDGNTQTTWTTLQVAGNTVQPLSQTSSTVIPMLLTDQQTLSKDVLNRQATACINLNSFLASEAKPVEQVMVKMPSCQQVPVQSLIPQPQATANILPLNPPVQVIQVAQPIGPAINPAPGNQNIIFLQPPTPAPCPPVLRAEVSKPAMGQQIVIIQAPTNQTQLPVMSAQPAPSVVLPLNTSNPAVCTSNTVQHSVTPQTVGGKHLVHILPRPTSVPSSTVQPCPVSTSASNQQTPTISLNGHLFALQPVTPSAGTSNQAPMQIIQPTTSEDPNTNVALNAFGALANLSQSISQMAGQSCVQFSVNPPTVSLTGASAPVNCISVAGAGVSAATTASSQALPLPSTPTKLLPVKPVGATPSNIKAKKAPKKPSVKKTAAKKEPVVSVKSDSLIGETSKQQPSSENPTQAGDTAGLVTSTNGEPDKLDASGGHSNNMMVGETGPLMVLNPSEEAIMLTEEQFSTEFPSAETCVSGEEQIPHSKAAEVFNTCTPTSDSPVTPAGNLVQGSVAVGLSQDQTTSQTAEASDAAVHKPCLAEADPPSLTATHLLEVQILSDDPKESSPSSLKLDGKEAAGSELLNRKAKSKEIQSTEQIGSDVLLLNTSSGHSAQPCVSEHEVAVSSACVNRQTDSPLSTSSGSSRNFSVASMLPDTSREDVIVTAVPSFNGSAFAEQSDIVAVAASVIFDQEAVTKGSARLQTEAGRAVSRDIECEVLSGDCRHPYKSQSTKENLVQVPTVANCFNPVGCAPLPGGVRLEEKNCPVGINSANLSLQISTSLSQTGTSLSINNLIHQSDVNHSATSCANVSQPSDQVGLSTASNTGSNTYENQSSALSGYSPEQLQTLRATVMQVTQASDSLLKHDEGRKEASKRCAHEDGLLSAAKRQKQCQPHARHESLQDSLSEQNNMLVCRVPTNATPTVSSSSQSHVDGLSTLFPPNSFVNTNLRQTDMRCSSQPAVSEQGQLSTQHLQPLPQLTANQQVSHLHNSNPYLKQQQQQHQSGLLREQHHLYQQHHVAHADSGIHSQSHNVQQQRLIQHDAQMQKKRGTVPSGQATRLSLQQKHQLSDQNRQKGGQQHGHHQQIQQQMAPHFGSSQVDKTCENNGQGRTHHPQALVNQEILHQHQQDVSNRPQGPVVSSEHLTGHSQVQRLMTSRSLEQQMVSQASIVSRPTNMTCAPHRQERNRVSSYSAEALIGKSSSSSEQRMGIAAQRLPDQLEMRKYMDVSRNKSLSVHNMQSRMAMDHPVNDGQHLPDCQTFKTGNSNQQQSGGFEGQTSRNNEVNPVSSMRGMQSQAYRISQNPNSAMDRQKHLPYQPVQEVPITNAVQIRENENLCHQSFMQSLLTPLIGEQIGSSQRSIPGHQRSQYNPSSGIEYSCPPARDSIHLRRDNDGPGRESCDLAMGQVTSRNNSLSIPFSSSSGDIQGRNTSPHSSMQKSNVMRQTDSHGSKNHLNIQVSINMHGVVHPSIPHQPGAHGNVDQRQTVRHGNPPIAQRSRHPLQEEADSKARQSERNRPGNQRHGNVFDPTLPHLPLAGPGSMIIGRQQSINEKRTGIVRFMPDGPQVTSDNPTADQHSLTQNFGFPFIPEGSMNPPINANPSFIPPVTQAAATRTPALIPVDPQNTLPSFYPSYSPAHPSLANDITIPYFSNQMFPNPSTEKPSGAGLNNRFGSILSPPRPVGFSQTTFPLLPDMTPMHMTNPSHLSNFNLTSLFPEIATALPAEGSAMSPLLSISHASNSESSKQSSNRPAHNISHILGHDSSSAV
ncbi:basic helix-loop-helix domain-containing protein USF3 [Spea bombifrons]|uniref:basic helix-loop-helix domain-containing protein USF3 n=1 Tax=Spea bombifrons TaxID=233779 RepID=UPI002349247D|nr:basic helix-loop-helix domain-containing protein USF3 [Spea bombifrons]XP_053311270.1 basic helix-loop-helix domain-containing protein USF3 [Spea bombifrons]